jgi:hypothetical protein
MGRPDRRAPAAARLAALALLLAALLAAPRCARAQLPPLPAELGPERPLLTPEPLRPDSPDARSGLQFGVGLPVVDLRSEALGVHLRGGSGALLHVEWVWDTLRLGYARQIYRADLPAGTLLGVTPVDQLAADSDQLWLFHGFRPLRRVFLGYGVGWQRRQLRLLDAAVQVDARTESGWLAGVMVDMALGLPFTVQLRAFGDVGGEGLLKMRSASAQLAFVAAF